ncbi:hypothetical protein C8J57DRAFT_1652901 [Mycena rebaudengoi]|nr:hypothetical protein C8J57DRAFT_1652901 [Mycena rebaudengoi]
MSILTPVFLLLRSVTPTIFAASFSPDEPPNSPLHLSAAIPGDLSVANHASGPNRLDLVEHSGICHLARIDTVNGDVNPTFVAGNQIRHVNNHYHLVSTLPPNVLQTALFSPFPEMPDSLRDILRARLETSSGPQEELMTRLESRHLRVRRGIRSSSW